MTVRAPVWLLIVALAAPLPLNGQDINNRPMPRPVSQTTEPLVAPTEDVALVKPMPRPNVLSAAVPSAPLQTASAAISPLSDTTPRPKARPAIGVQTASAAIAATGGLSSSPFPAPRPKALVAAVAAINSVPSPSPSPAPKSSSPAPSKPGLIQLLFGAGSGAKLPKGADGEDLASAAPAPLAPTSNTPRKGSVCGDRAIRGEKIKPITSSVNGCGVADPVRVTEVAGIKLSQAVTVECDTVIALKDWIGRAMRPAFGNREVVQLRIAAHYACRGRNNKRGARVSEHGKGKALDISGFIFDTGEEWTISRDYNKQIRKAHQGACGIFGTTLGPGSDGYHEDHLHFDTARYRSGTYCR